MAIGHTMMEKGDFPFGTITASEVTGVVLAGGSSTRMGRDKALLMFKGKLFVELVAQEMHKVFQEVVISSNTSAYGFTGLPLVRDVYHEFGPLAGIHAAMCCASTPYIFSAPCDTPLLHSTLIQSILTHAAPDYITTVKAQGSHHPLIALYPCGLRGTLGNFLAGGKRKVNEFLSTVPHRTVCLNAFGASLLNINTADDYRRLRLLDTEESDARSFAPRIG